MIRSMNTTTNNLIDRLEEAHAGGLSWDEIATRAGITTPALRRIRTGESAPRARTIRALEQAVNAPSGPLTGQGVAGRVLVLEVKRAASDADLARAARVFQAMLDVYLEGV